MTSELAQEAFLESVTDLQFSLSLLQCGLSEREDRKQGGKIQIEDVVWGDTQGPAATEDSGLKTQHRLSSGCRFVELFHINFNVRHS